MKNLLKAIGIFCLCGIGFTILSLVLAFAAPEFSSSLAGIYVTQTLSLVIVFGIPALWGIRVTEKGNPFELTGMKRGLDGRQVLLVVALAVVAIPMVSWLEEWNKKLPLPQVLQMMEEAATALTERLMNTHSVGQLIVNILVIGGVPAICEELMFRGWIQRRLTGAMNHHLGIWIAAIIFSAVHLQFQGFVPRMMLGAMLGYAYYYTGSLWASAIVHFLNNSIACVVGFLIYNNVLEETEPSWAVAIALVAVVITVVYYLSRRAAEHEK